MRNFDLYVEENPLFSTNNWLAIRVVTHAKRTQVCENNGSLCGIDE